jgi:tryptophan-rich sensory protein
LGDYTGSYLFTYLFTVAFYGLFLWLLSGVFHAFKQKKLFTEKGAVQLSRFYITNLLMPFLFLVLFLFFRNDMSDIIRIMFLHLVIGVFAYFMAAIFKQGLLLQEEQDLTF